MIHFVRGRERARSRRETRWRGGSEGEVTILKEESRDETGRLVESVALAAFSPLGYRFRETPASSPSPLSYPKPSQLPPFSIFPSLWLCLMPGHGSLIGLKLTFPAPHQQRCISTPFDNMANAVTRMFNQWYEATTILFNYTCSSLKWTFFHALHPYHNNQHK